MNRFQVQPDPEFKRCHQDVVYLCLLALLAVELASFSGSSQWPLVHTGSPLWWCNHFRSSPFLLGDSQTLRYTSFLEVLNQNLNLLYDWCGLGHLIVPEPIAVPKRMWCAEWLRPGHVLSPEPWMEPSADDGRVRDGHIQVENVGCSHFGDKVWIHLTEFGSTLRNDRDRFVLKRCKFISKPMAESHPLVLQFGLPWG